MSVSHQALSRALHHLSQVAPVAYRRIFTNVGLYYKKQLFALIVDDRLYFRVDEASVAPYLQRTMPALKPGPAVRHDSRFYALPESVLEQPPELMYWMRAAVEASQPLAGTPVPELQAAPDTWRYSSAG